jgi:hypothetical protein
MRPKHVPIAILAFAAAGLIVFSLFTRGWWTGKDEDDGEVRSSVAVGIFSFEECRRETSDFGYGDYDDYDDDRDRRRRGDDDMRCESQDFDEMGSDFKTWRRLGLLWVFGGLVAASSMVLLAMMALQRRSRKFPTILYAGPVLFGVLAMVLWLAWNKAASGDASPSYSFFLAVLGFGAATGAIWLRLYDAPPAAPLGYAAAAQPQHPCPRCLNPLVFVHQYGRWYCPACQQYP